MGGKSLRLLLVEPPFYRLFKESYSLDRYPLSMGYLAGTVKMETDWEVKAYNADFVPDSVPIEVRHRTGPGFQDYLNNLKDQSGAVWQEVRSTLAEQKPGVVGISAKSQNFAAACIVARLAKENNKDTVTIMGGPHPSMVGPEVMKCPDIDIAVRGEGECTIVRLLKAIEAHKDLGDVRGICYRHNGDILETPSVELIEDLDSLCFPHRSAPEVLLDYEKYPPEAFKYIFALRGCPNKCFFCGSRKVWTRKVRFRSVENVTEEIKGLQKKGLTSVHFDDDIFGVSKRHITELCDAIKNHCSRLRWSCETHVHLVDDETMSIMKDAGCYSIQLGVESGNDEILKAMRKGYTSKQALKACKTIKKHGIQLQAFFMVGFPQETEETLRDTVLAMRKAKCDAVTYSIFTPYPGTEAFEYCREHGLIDEDYDVSLYNHQSPANCFCEHIDKQRFRELVSRVEKMADRKNAINRLKRVFSAAGPRKVRELGVLSSIRLAKRSILKKV